MKSRSIGSRRSRWPAGLVASRALRMMRRLRLKSTAPVNEDYYKRQQRRGEQGIDCLMAVAFWAAAVAVVAYWWLAL